MAYCQMALDYPELSKQRTALKCFDVFYVLAHNGKLAKPWEEGKPDHAGKTGEEDLQGADVASFLYNFFIGHSIGHALLRKIFIWENNLYLARPNHQSRFGRKIQEVQ